MDEDNHLRKLGIFLISTIMLSSIVPFQAFNSHNLIQANASTKARKQSNVKLYSQLITKHYFMNKVKRNKYLYSNIKKAYKRAHHTKSKKVRNRNQNEIINMVDNYAHRIGYANSRNKIVTSHKNILRKRINRSINPYYLNKSQNIRLHTYHIRQITPIHAIVHHQNLNQQHIHWIVTHKYKPAHVPTAMRDIRSNNWLNGRLNRIRNHQKNKKAKVTVNQIANNDKQVTNNLHQRLNGEESDNERANQLYIQRLNHENKIINYGLNMKNTPVYNDYMRNMQNIKDFSHTTRQGRAIQREANRRTKAVEKTIGRHLKKHDTNREDDYEDKLLDSWATNNNSAAQYYEKHLTLNEVLQNIHNPNKRKQIIKEYNNVHNHKNIYNRSKQAYDHRNDKGYHNRHFSRHGLRKYQKYMNKYDRLKASKQTAKIKAEERRDYQMAQAAKKQQLNSIDNQINQIEQQISALQKQYNNTKDKWEDAVGNVPMRNQLHTQMNNIQNQINQLQNQISKLEEQATGVEQQMENNRNNSKKQRYRHMLLGNIKTMKNISHPKYVRISAPTYYFNSFDITNPGYRSMKIKPNQPKNHPNHWVNYAKEIILNDGKKYLLYNINTEDENLQHDAFIIARYTTPVKVKPFKWNIHWMNFNTSGETKHRTRYAILDKNKVLENSPLKTGYLSGNKALHIEKMGYQGNNKKDRIMYKAVTEYGKWDHNPKTKHYGDYVYYYGRQQMIIPASAVYTNRGKSGNNIFY